MRTYDKLKRKDKDKLNAIMLYEIPYHIVTTALFIAGIIVVTPIALFLCVGDIMHVLYGFMLWGIMVILYALIRMVNNEKKNAIKKYFGVDNIGKDIFKE